MVDHQKGLPSPQIKSTPTPKNPNSPPLPQNVYAINMRVMTCGSHLLPLTSPTKIPNPPLPSDSSTTSEAETPNSEAQAPNSGDMFVTSEEEPQATSSQRSEFKFPWITENTFGIAVWLLWYKCKYFILCSDGIPFSYCQLWFVENTDCFLECYYFLTIWCIIYSGLFVLCVCLFCFIL